MPRGSPFKAGTRRLKKGYRFLKGGRAVKAKSKPARRTRRKATRRKSSCVAFKLPTRGRGGRFKRGGRRR